MLYVNELTNNLIEAIEDLVDEKVIYMTTDGPFRGGAKVDKARIKLGLAIAEIVKHLPNAEM